jgi:hypothetical protein
VVVHPGGGTSGWWYIRVVVKLGGGKGGDIASGQSYPWSVVDYC